MQLSVRNSRNRTSVPTPRRGTSIERTIDQTKPGTRNPALKNTASKLPKVICANPPQGRLRFTRRFLNPNLRLRGLDPTHVHASQQALFDEMTAFPFGEHDDLLDAAATGTAYLLDWVEPRMWRR